MNTLSEDKEIPLITFNSLYNVLREEKKNNLLTTLPEDFYSSLKKFLGEKKKEVHKLKSQGSEREKLRKEMNIFKNSQKISKELISLRLIKISQIAIKNGVYSEVILNKENLLSPEEEIFKKIEKISKSVYEEIK